MTDTKSPEERSRNMSRIRSEDTKPEMIVRRALWHAGFRYRLHRKDLPGHPDMVMSGRRIVIFVHGCFWHSHEGCRKAAIPSSRREYWLPKLERNRRRDLEAKEALLAAGWRVLWVWECALNRKSDREALPEILTSWIEGKDGFSELPASS